MNIRNLKRLAVTISVIILIGAALNAQPKSETYAFAEQAALARLDNLMNDVNRSVRYNAPEAYVADELTLLNEKHDVDDALSNLELLANLTEKELQYSAPDEEVDHAYQNLELLASVTERELVYRAPFVEPAPETIQNTNRNERFASKRAGRPVQLELVNYTLQETWLIKAGYYKTTKTPAWNKIRRNYKDRSDKSYVSEF